MISCFKLFLIILTTASVAGCALVFAADSRASKAGDGAGQIFETRVDDKWTASYRLPTDHEGFSPLPLKQLTLGRNDVALIGGFSYPSGLFDRIIFSTLYWVSVHSFKEPLRAGISAAEFVAVSTLESKRKRAESKANGAMFVPEAPDFHIETFSDSWWVCNDVIRTEKGPGISEYTCRKPVVGIQIIDVTVRFARSVEKRSESYEVARKKVHQIVASVSLKLE